MRAAVALLAVLTLVTACGGSDTAAGPASSAEVLKPGAVVYWQTVTDPDSDQWEQVEDLLAKFPDGDRLIAWVKHELADQDLSWEDDVRPALGSVVDVVVYPGSQDIPTVVGLTNSENKQKLVELVAKLNGRGDEPLATRTVGDWVAISTSHGEIDRALKEPGENALADDDAFESAIADLPDDALTRVYVDPARAVDIVGGHVERLLGLDELDFAGAWAKAKENGAELALDLRGPGADTLFGTGRPYASDLLERVPEDAFAFVSFNGEALRRGLEALDESPLSGIWLRRVERELGVSVVQLARIFGGEVALFARHGSPNVELTLLSETDDEVASFEAAKTLLRSLAAKLDGRVFDEGDVFRVTFADALPLALTTLDGVLVLTTARSGLDDLRSSNDKLPDSERFEEALEAAGTPDEYIALAYVDLSEAIPVVEDVLGFRGSVPLAVRRNLEPLKSVVAFGAKEGDKASARVFVEID